MNDCKRNLDDELKRNERSLSYDSTISTITVDSRSESYDSLQEIRKEEEDLKKKLRDLDNEYIIKMERRKREEKLKLSSSPQISDAIYIMNQVKLSPILESKINNGYMIEKCDEKKQKID